MNIAVFGLGYVGCVSTACFADLGHTVIGVDVNPAKVDMINAGQSPMIEPRLAELLAAGVSAGKIRATLSVEEAVTTSEVLLICVGTPSNHNGSLRLDYVLRVVQDIGSVLATTSAYKVVALRSTTLPGAVREQILPALEASSGKVAGRDFGFVTNPEFLREGSAIHDFYHPPFTIIGEFDVRSGDVMQALYSELKAPLYRTPLGAAEMVKYASNAFHALKVTFANEIGNICKTQGIDSHQVMEIFCQDKQLNLSPYYLKPGFAFGGSCLPKDVRAILYQAHQCDTQVPVLESILPSNAAQIQRGLEMVLATGKRKVGVIGLSFKPSTDDLRESPAVELVEQLLDKGFELLVYDREIMLTQLLGSNREFIQQVIPHIASLMSDSLADIVASSEVLIFTKRPTPEILTQLASLLTTDHILIDLVRISGASPQTLQGDYRGICW